MKTYLETLTVGNRYLFDTTVFIGLLRNRKRAKDFHYQKRFLQIFVGYSIITETELWVGMKFPRTESQHTEVLRVYHRYFINVTIARNAGMFMGKFMSDGLSTQQKTLPPITDCLIAATAQFYNLRLVSNDKHAPLFRQFGVFVDEYQDVENAP